ncbi:TonB-dependent receptor [Sphingomonas sinipercae]|uniref:TonB-dependent receptor n=1 Tax=Sphingomonas sinipercae TaxID=2714944 RepID=A0A6G7ZQH3_9SPHN|nr:TonB-dependent receptor [Sphingomonas sinipercae]
MAQAQPMPGIAAAAGPTLTDEAVAGGATETTESATEVDANETSPAALEEIVVTATKRETNLQRTPIAISVVTTQALDDRHVQSLADLADGSVPGLRVATFEARQSALTIGIRGIVPLDANQPAREQGVGVYVDGVYLGRQQGLGAALLDVERIEVLKGPQGTLFGRNTEGGALSIVTRAPTGKFGLRATAGAGNYGSYSANAHLDLPAAGPFSFKIDAAMDHQDATTRNPLAGQVGWNYFNRKGVQGKIRFKPSDTFVADLSADAGRDENTPFYSQLLNHNPNGYPVGPLTGSLPSGSIRPLPPLVVVEGDERMDVADIGVVQQVSVDKTKGGALNLRWDATPDLQLRSITGCRQVSVDQWDNSGGAHRPPVFAANGNFSRYSLSYLEQSQWSQELQAVGQLADQVDYVFGLYYFREKAFEEAATPSTNRWNADGTGYTINDPCIGSGSVAAPAGWQRECRRIDRGSRARSESKAAYGQLTWTPPSAERFHVTLGGRLTRDDKQGTLYIVNNEATDFSFDQKTTRFNPLAIVAYDATPDAHFYAKYATGYRSGGASSRSLTHTEFGPEDVQSYELGAKTQLFDRRLRLNVAGYVMSRKGTQVDFSVLNQLPGGATRNTLETVNAPGTSKIRGIEVDATAQVTDQLQLSASYAYTYTKVPDAPDPFRPGNPLVPVFIPFTPRNVVNGAIDYELPTNIAGGKLRLHLDGNYNQATQSFAEFATKNDSSFIVNGRLALADMEVGTGQQVTFALWSRNLLNETHVYRRDPTNSMPNPFTGSRSNIVGDYGNFNAPRTFGVEALVKI